MPFFANHKFGVSIVHMYVCIYVVLCGWMKSALCETVCTFVQVNAASDACVLIDNVTYSRPILHSACLLVYCCKVSAFHTSSLLLCMCSCMLLQIVSFACMGMLKCSCVFVLICSHVDAHCCKFSLLCVYVTHIAALPSCA